MNALRGRRAVALFWLGCVACVGSKAPAGSDADSAPPDAQARDSGTALDTSLATDATVPDGDSGEYCPDPAYPQRADGCPCFPPVGGCTTEQLGKTCDYLQMCPGGAIGGASGTRARCELVTPPEGLSVKKWVKSPAPCPADAAPG